MAGDEPVEHLVLGLQVPEHRMRQQVPASPPGSHEPAVPAQEHQPLGLPDGKLAQERLVHEREDRRVRTDAEADRQQRDGGEGAVPKQPADRVPDVVPQLLQHRRPPASVSDAGGDERVGPGSAHQSVIVTCSPPSRTSASLVRRAWRSAATTSPGAMWPLRAWRSACRARANGTFTATASRGLSTRTSSTSPTLLLRTCSSPSSTRTSSQSGLSATAARTSSATGR